MNIMWFSKHPPIQKQIAELKRLFGSETEVMQDPNPFSSANDIVKRYHRSGAKEMVVVAPLSVIDQLVKRGIKPLYAEMEQVNGDECDVLANGRKFIFKKFTRITGIIIEKEELQ